MVNHDDNIIPTPSDTVNSVLLAASTPEADSIPAGAKIVLLMASTSPTFFRISAAASAAVPGDITNGTASQLIAPNGTLVSLQGARTTGWITTGTAALTVQSTDGMTIGDTLIVTGAGAAGVDLSQTISSINQTTKVVTLGGNASTTVEGTAVTESITQISVISAGTPIVTFAYYK